MKRKSAIIALSILLILIYADIYVVVKSLFDALGVR